MLRDVIARLEQAVFSQAGAAFTYRECCLLLGAAHCLDCVTQGREMAIRLAPDYHLAARGEEAALYAELLSDMTSPAGPANPGGSSPSPFSPQAAGQGWTPCPASEGPEAP